MDEVVAATYRQFAELEAKGVSDTYYGWAIGVAEDPAVRRRIATLPGSKKQPNLVFAAARFLGAEPGPYAQFAPWLHEHWSDVERVVLERSTQTNEAARSAVLLPVLSRLQGNLALIEVGAAAGLVLYPDRYSYRYDADGEIVHLDPDSGPSTVQIPCTINVDAVPPRLPEIVWRAGIDLNPLDVGNADDMLWLETLIWPEHDARRERLRAAAALVTEEPPYLVSSDLLEKVSELIAQAPQGSHIVVFHSAVLVYLPVEQREAFANMMLSLPNVTWVSNEGARVLPSIATQLPPTTDGRMVLAVDGVPVALTGPHGQSYESIKPSVAPPSA